MTILYIFIFIVAYKFIRNMINFLKCKLYHKLYLHWLENPNEEFKTYKSSMVNLIKNAGIENAVFRDSQYTSTGHVVPITADAYTNFLNRDESVVSWVHNSFYTAIGIYRKRTIDAINPLYWIDLIIFLPRHILEYLNIKTDTLASKILQVLLHFLWWGTTTLVSYFKDDIVTFLVEHLEKILG